MEEVTKEYVDSCLEYTEAALAAKSAEISSEMTGIKTCLSKEIEDLKLAISDIKSKMDEEDLHAVWDSRACEEEPLYVIYKGKKYYNPTTVIADTADSINDELYSRMIDEIIYNPESRELFTALCRGSTAPEEALLSAYLRAICMKSAAIVENIRDAIIAKSK